MTLELVTMEASPNASILKKPAQDLQFPLSNDIKILIEDMKTKLLELKGVGLAASQVGHHIRLFIFHVRDQDLQIRKEAAKIVPLTVLINASYTPIEEEGIFEDWEACFSITSVMGKVPRYRSIWYQGYTEEGEFIEAKASGFLARLLQHEIDHTRGRIITDLLTAKCLQGPLEEMMLIRQQELEMK